MSVPIVKIGSVTGLIFLSPSQKDWQNLMTVDEAEQLIERLKAAIAKKKAQEKGEE